MLNHNVDPATNRLASLSGSQNILLSYDANGNVVARGAQTYGFDIGNRMRLATGKASYLYDGEGRRALVTYADGSWRRHVYGQNGKLMFTQHSSQGSTRYVYLDGQLVAEIHSATGPTYVHADPLGSPLARTNAAGQITARTRYEPYGATAAGNVPNGVGFTGHVNDVDTGLVYMQQRYYDPIAGRFLSVDPVVTDAKTGDSFNRYVYGNNDPYVFLDPDGRQSLAYRGMSLSAQTVGWGQWGGTSAVAQANQQLAQALTKAFKDEGTGAAAASGAAPPPNDGDGGKHGGDQHDRAIRDRVDEVRAHPDTRAVRMNQQQVDVNGNRVGMNKPDLQFDKFNRVTREWEHHNIEWDFSPRRSQEHGRVIRANDPNSKVELNILRP